MATKEKPWHICDDCLAPLQNDLSAFVNRFHRPFDVLKQVRLESEFSEVTESVAYAADEKEDLLNALLREIGEQTRPPCSEEVEVIYSRYDIDMAAEWLGFSISVDYGNHFKQRLFEPLKRFSALEFKAQQIINGDIGRDETDYVRYALQLLENRHCELLRSLASELGIGRRPELHEMPEEMRQFEKQILDEYACVEKEFRETVAYLNRISALVLAKLLRANVPEEDPLTPTQSRNKFCYEQWQAGKTHGEINAALKKHSEWEAFDDEKSVRGPIAQWAKQNGNLPIRSGQPGRRKKAN